MSDKKEMIVYHASTIMLGEGSEILPGNWGRRLVLMQTTIRDPVLWEHVLEIVRLDKYPKKPSRLTAFFATPTLEEALQYKAEHCRENIIYEVSVNVRSVDVHHGNYNIKKFNEPLTIGELYQRANMYWSEEPEDYVELVIPAPGYVIRMS